MIGSWMISPEAGRALFFAVVILLVGWFAAGMLVNVRKGNRVARWLQDGLPLLGEKTTLRWLGSSGIELKLQNPRKPLVNVEIFILLEPRDVPFLWGFFHLRGRRDVLFVRCHSSANPRFQLEAAGPHPWPPAGTRFEEARKQWTSLSSSSPARLIAYAEGQVNAAEQLLETAGNSELRLARLSVRKATPQLEIHWYLQQFEKASAQQLFETILQLIRTL